jgi:hypothetical protein
MAEALEEASAGAKIFKDLFSGAMGGIAQVLIGQPFGTLLRTRIGAEKLLMMRQISSKSVFKQPRNTQEPWTARQKSFATRALPHSTKALSLH